MWGFLKKPIYLPEIYFADVVYGTLILGLLAALAYSLRQLG